MTLWLKQHQAFFYRCAMSPEMLQLYTFKIHLDLRVPPFAKKTLSLSFRGSANLCKLVGKLVTRHIFHMPANWEESVTHSWVFRCSLWWRGTHRADPCVSKGEVPCQKIYDSCRRTYRLKETVSTFFCKPVIDTLKKPTESSIIRTINICLGYCFLFKKPASKQSIIVTRSYSI